MRDKTQTLRGLRAKRFGFTLIEVMLAVAILAALTLTAWGAINQMFVTENVVTERQERYRMVRLAMNRMATEISMAYIAGPDHGGEEIPGQEDHFFDDDDEADPWGMSGFEDPIQYGMIGGDDYLHFTSFGHVRTVEGERASHHAQIGYFVDTHTNEDGEVVSRLRRRSSTNFDDDLTRGGTVHTMIPEIEDIRFEYWDPGEPELGTEEEIVDGRWVSDWDTTRRDFAGRLPTRVRITLVLPPQGPRAPSETFTTQTTLGVPEMLEY